MDPTVAVGPVEPVLRSSSASLGNVRTSVFPIAPAKSAGMTVAVDHAVNVNS